MRTRSSSPPIHVHVNDITPVHVHVKSQRKSPAKSPQVGEVLFSSLMLFGPHLFFYEVNVQVLKLYISWSNVSKYEANA